MNVTPLRRTVLQLLLASLLMTLATGCAYQLPRRPWVNHPSTPENAGLGCQATPPAQARAFATPEQGPPDKPYTLHFIEFDDQGRTYPDSGFAGPYDRVGNPSRQLDCALADLRHKLNQGPVALYLYVHGWHHNAGPGDSDIRTFRERVLGEYAFANARRQVVGIYVGWEGETIDIPGLSHLTTFLSRKNAAHRVADGRLRELFARIRGLRQLYNAGAQDQACADTLGQATEGAPANCRLRTVMIGHSFGGLILYAAIQPYLLETLSMAFEQHSPATAATPDREHTERLRRAAPRPLGIADLVVLLNPAFEASKHEPLHRAAERLVSVSADAGRQPLLVSLTSTGDIATRRAFPLARYTTTIFQYPANTAEQEEALRDTIGNVDAYLTHDLCLAAGSCNFKDLAFDGAAHAAPCDQLRLRRKLLPRTSPDEPEVRMRVPPIWNVRTHGDIIRNHNAISGPFVAAFLEWALAEAMDWQSPCRSTPALTAPDSAAPEAAGQPAPRNAPQAPAAPLR